jgi:hypothetical protein
MIIVLKAPPSTTFEPSTLNYLPVHTEKNSGIFVSTSTVDKTQYASMTVGVVTGW